MKNRSLAIVALVLGAISILLSAYLVSPADVVEFLLPLLAASLTAVQGLLITVGLVMLALSQTLSPATSRGLRVARIALVATAVMVVGATLVRDYARYSRETVRFAGYDVNVEGTVYSPRGVTGKVPGVLILHGSGDSPRRAYHFIARRFAERGFIVLNVDKRGVGGSEGRYYGDDLGKGVIEQRARDSRPALDYLARHPDVDVSRIGVVSFSQGGWVAPLLLAGDTPARFAVNFSGPAVSSAEENVWSDWTGEDQDHFGLNPPPVPFEELYRRLADVKPGDFDPRPHLARMRAPSLWLLGEWDSSMPSQASLGILDSLRVRGLPITARMFPGANHGLMVVRGPGGSRLASFAPGTWDTAFAWIERVGEGRTAQEGND